ncbi:MAG: quinone-dependent dihydroorotate dehydrogenase [Calditrichia bacterium]
MYSYLLKPLLFLFSAETAHNVTFKLLGIPGISHLLGWMYGYEDTQLEREVFGLTFRNPIGLAAGFDKNAIRYKQFGRLGFGFVEIGTITPEPQAGNPKPRLFRLDSDEALINRMGFNNDGLQVACERLKKRDTSLVLGGNIGKNKMTPNEDAISDYEKCFEVLYPFVDYFTVNVSSPNTPNLRELQDKKPLTKLLNHVQQLNMAKPQQKPILLKIAPDLSDSQLDDIIAIVKETGISGVIATNTTISRAGLKTTAEKTEAIGNGGLSGKPLKDRSTEVIRYLHSKSGGAFPIIGVGGIHSVNDAKEKFEAGASLIQLYSGFVYEGPSLLKSIKKALV